MPTNFLLWTFLVLLLGTSGPLLAQTATNAPQPRRATSTPNDSLKSPEVMPDGRAVFRIYAPKATEISLSGDWIAQGLGTGGPLAKDDQGIWSMTIGPLPADLYSYAFTVDGVHTIDPRNGLIKPGIRGADSLFFLPGKEAAYIENERIPHGAIQQVWYSSSTLGMQRRMHVYVPPGYEQHRNRLPVLYLLHGGGDEDSGWSTVGRAGFILDNLLAEKRAKPMLIVMPNGSMPPTERAAGSPGASNSVTNANARAAAQLRFSQELMNDIIPFVEKNFRVRAGRRNRALAGLSMGGGQTLRILLSNPDQFSYVAIWSAGLFGQKPDEFEQRNADFIQQAVKVNAAVKLLSISVGERDFALNGSKDLDVVFNRNGIHHEMHISAGGHTWINWRHYLHNLVPRLFP